MFLNRNVVFFNEQELFLSVNVGDKSRLVSKINFSLCGQNQENCRSGRPNATYILNK